MILENFISTHKSNLNVLWFFWFSRLCVWTNWKHCPMSKNTITKLNGIHRICAKLTYTFWYIDMSDKTASYGTTLDFITFFWVFSYIIDDYWCLNCCIFTIKLSQIVCESLCQMTASYGMLFDLIEFFMQFSVIWLQILRLIFHNFTQTV